MESKRKKITATSDSSSHATSRFSSPGALPADIEAKENRFLYLFDQVDKTTLFDGLKNALMEGNRPLIESMSKVFKKSDFPSQSSP